MIPATKQSLLLELTDRFQNGYRNAFAELWEKVQGYVFQIMKQGIDEPTARDLTSEVCRRLYGGKLAQYHHYKGASFIAWLHKFARRIKIDELRRSRHYSPIDPATAEQQGICKKAFLSEASVKMSEDPLDILIEKESSDIRQKTLGLLPHLLLKLSAVEQYVIYACFWEDRTDKEIAIELTGDEKYAGRYQQMRQRALKKLGRMFAEHGITEYPG